MWVSLSCAPCTSTSDEAFVLADHTKWGEAFFPSPPGGGGSATLYFHWKSTSPDTARTGMNTRGLYLGYSTTFMTCLATRDKKGFPRKAQIQQPSQESIVSLARGAGPPYRDKDQCHVLLKEAHGGGMCTGACVRDTPGIYILCPLLLYLKNIPERNFSTMLLGLFPVPISLHKHRVVSVSTTKIFSESRASQAQEPQPSVGCLPRVSREGNHTSLERFL